VSPAVASFSLSQLIFIAEQTRSSLALTTLMFSVEACASLLSVGRTSKMMDLYGHKVMMITGLVLQASNLLLMTEQIQLIGIQKCLRKLKAKLQIKIQLIYKLISLQSFLI